MPSPQTLILNELRESADNPPKLAALGRRLGVARRDRHFFENLVESLIQNGRIIKARDGRLTLATRSETGERTGSAKPTGAAERTDAAEPTDTASDNADVTAGLIVGVIRKTMKGDAWLIPELDPAKLSDPSYKPTSKKNDLFIDARDLRDAHSGDQVLVRLTGRHGAAGKRYARVEKVIERATHTFVGTYEEELQLGRVRVDGGAFAEPVVVGDPGSKGVRPGDKVVIEMVRFPTRSRAGEAVLTKVLGVRGTPGVDEQSIIHELGLPDEFPEPVLQEARERVAEFDESVPDSREDLTAETIITIDPADARDFDDAISLTRSENGHWLLGVHTADVAHFVREGGPLDVEARKRGTSVYLPGRVLPMIPETISNSLASLQKGKVRFTKSVFIEFTANGTAVHTEFKNTAIKVTQRFAYEQVMPLLRGSKNETLPQITGKVRQLLQDMHELAMTLRRRRFERGSLELFLPEVKIELDKNGAVSGAKLVEHDESHQVIEEFMLAANEAVATELTARDVTFLRRAHGSPDPVKLSAFSQFVDSLGLTLDGMGRYALQKLLDSVRGKQMEQSVNYALLRSMKQAEYTGATLGHFALSIEHYCHFTSPIRRYPDLTVHRLVDQIVTGKKKIVGHSTIDTIKLGTHCSTTERRAAAAERELTRVKLLTLLESKTDEIFDAIVTGVEKFGIFCRAEQYPVDGFIHVTELSPGEYIDYDRTTYTLSGRQSGLTIRLGDRVQVRTGHVDPEERTLTWILVRGNSPTPKRQSKNSGKPFKEDRHKLKHGEKQGKPKSGSSPKQKSGSKSKSKPASRKKNKSKRAKSDRGRQP